MSTPILRTSERKDWKRCQRRWWWAWRQGLRQKGSESTPLWFGTGVHLAFERWYVPGFKRGIHPAETFQEFAEEGAHSIKVSDATEERIAEYEDGLALGVRLMDEYVKYWGTDEAWEIVQSEQTFGIDVPWPADQKLYEVEPGAVLIKYHGKYDGVYRDHADEGKLKLLETKTAKAISTGHLTLDDQAGSYWAIAGFALAKAGIIKPREQLYGITYNFVRKGLPDERPKDAEGYFTNKPTKADYLAALGSAADPKMKVIDLEALAAKRKLVVLGERSKTQPAPIFQRHDVHRTRPERRTQLKRIQNEALQMQAARDGLIPLSKTPTRDCNWDCSFFAMCELEERDGDWKTFQKAVYKVEDPYIEHRKSAED